MKQANSTKIVLLTLAVSLFPIGLLALFSILGVLGYVLVAVLFGYFYATARDEAVYDYHISSERQREAIERYVAEVKKRDTRKK